MKNRPVCSALSNPTQNSLYAELGNGVSINAFTCNGSFTTLSDPLAAGFGGTSAFGVSGNNIVGRYFDSAGRSHGFLYNGSTWSTLDFPGTFTGTAATGVDANGNIIGDYTPPSGGNGDGFLMAVPEPCSLTLVGVGLLALFARRRKNE